MTTGDVAAPVAPKKKFEFTACGPSAKLSREALQEILLIYGAAIGIRILIKGWTRFESPLFLAGAALAALTAVYLFARMIRRRDYWPVFIGGAAAFASFFRFDDTPLAAGTALEKPLVLLPILPAVLATGAFFAMLRDADELERRINYQALALAFTITFGVCLAYALLEDLGLPRVSSIWWWLVLAISWVVGLAVYARRYQ